jgi:sulfur carrier protein
MRINGSEHVLEQEHSLEDVLKQLGMDTRKGIAVSVNQRIIPRIRWKDEKMDNKDELVIIEASQGG